MATTIQYKLKKGDTLSSLGIPAEILKANPGLSKLSAGAVINIPVGAAAAKGGIAPSGGGLTQGTGLGGFLGGKGGPPGGGPNTIWKGGPQVTQPPGFQSGANILPQNNTNTGFQNGSNIIKRGGSGFQNGSNIIPGQNGNSSNTNTGFQNGSNIINRGGSGFQNGSNIIPGQGGNTGGQYNGGGNSQWIDFENVPAGMSWDEYNARLAQAQAEGYKGPFLMPDASGVGQLMWDAGRPVQGAVYNDNGTVRGIGRGNIKTTSTYSNGGGSSRNSRSLGRGKGPNGNGNNGADFINRLLANNPALANDPNFQWMIQQLGGQQPASQGNTGGNNAVNGNMNWRF